MDKTQSETSSESKLKKESALLIQKKDEQISALTKEKDEYIDKWKRALAELENYRKRSEKQLEETRKFAIENVLYKLLSVVDNFERALVHIGNSNSTDTLKQGVEMIYKELRNLLNQYGVKPIDALGKEYDPNFHEALEIVNQQHHKKEKNKGNDKHIHIVVKEILPGYTFHNRLLRPAKVKISDSVKTEEPKMLKGEKNE